MPDRPTSATLTGGQFAAPSSTPLELVGRSATVARLREVVRRAAALDSGVLIVAEAGVDAASVARELHRRRSTGRWIPVDCSARDVSRVLFGASRESSASGRAAIRDFEEVSAASAVASARGGTLLLQSVTDLPAASQARLARVARDGDARVDGETVALDVRLIATAAPGIEEEVQAGRLRADLFRRLSESRIDLPPLRARADDLPAMAERALEECCAAQRLGRRSFTDAALALVSALTWPGNLTELRGVIARVAAAASGPAIQIEQILPAIQLDRAPAAFVPAGTLREARLRFERDYIASVLQHHGWRMAPAAEALGMQRPNLYRKARQLGIPLGRIPD